jgi:hypothetical protein
MSRFRKTAIADPALAEVLPALFDYAVGSHIMFSSRGEIADIGWGVLQESTGKKKHLFVQNELYDNFNFRPQTPVNINRRVFAYKFADSEMRKLIEGLPAEMVRDMLVSGQNRFMEAGTDRLGSPIEVGALVGFVPRFGGLRLGRVVKAPARRQLEIIELTSGTYELCYVSRNATLVIPIAANAVQQVKTLKNNEIRNFYITPEGDWR